ncbi:TPA: flippase [Escherichia coli]|nr:flippase [Shigella boydii]EEY8694220.1 flippase [Escherichia coli]EFZ0025527.1 flippase [Shigella dysenteriae]OWD37304.1 polysaccharide biosynthesis protein [Escherichia coli]RCQ45866.1 flippase [Escherichia coli]
MKTDLTVFKNIISLFSIRFAGYIIPLITLPYLVKVLQPVGFGYLSFGIAVLQYCTLVVNYGFDLSATRKIAQNRENVHYISDIFWNILFLRLFISLVGFLVLVVFIHLFPDLYRIKWILLWGYLSVLGTALFPMWLFQGKEQLGRISAARIFLQISCVPLFFVFVKNTQDDWVASLIYALPQLLISVVAVYIIHKRKWIVLKKIKLATIKKELIDGWHLFISTAAISLYTTTITVVLGIVSGPYSVAIYTSANKILQAAQGLYQPISSAFYPRINNLMKENKQLAFKTIRKLFKIQFVITICISVGLFLFSNIVVDILYGDDYRNAALILQLLSPIPIVVGCSNIFGIQILLTCGYKKEFSTILLISGLINMILIFPLCYKFNEFGAAFSVLITEIFVTVSMLFVVILKKIPVWESKRNV